MRFVATFDSERPTAGVIVDEVRRRYCTFPSLPKAQEAAERWNGLPADADPPMAWRSVATGERLEAKLPGAEDCPGHLTWSAFGANYPDTVCASALEWEEGYAAYGLCDADDDFREKDVPCPFCDPDAFIEYQWSVSSGEHVILWAADERAVAPETEIHFHDDTALWWTATHPERGEERVLFRSLISEWEATS